MLTPVEMQNRTLKSGRGYKKKEMDEFLEEIYQNYEQLYKENLELKDKLSVLSDGLQYYKDLEKTLQKTLVVAEKAAEETRTASISKANSIEQKAKAQARYIIEDAKKQAEKIHNQTLALLQQYENYRSQYKQLVAAQLELMESDAFHLHLNNIADNPEFLNVKYEPEECEKAEPKIKKEPVIKRVPFLNEDKKTSAKLFEDKKAETEIPKDTIIEEKKEIIKESDQLEPALKKEAPDLNKIKEKEEEKVTATETVEIEKPILSKNNSVSKTAKETIKEEEIDRKKTIVKAELRKELKRPDRLKTNKPEQLSVKKEIAQINAAINKDLEQIKKGKSENEDDTFEFL